MREFCKGTFRYRVSKLRVAIRVKLSAQSHPPHVASKLIRYTQRSVTNMPLYRDTQCDYEDIPT